MWRARVFKLTQSTLTGAGVGVISECKDEFATLGEALDFINGRVDEVLLVSNDDKEPPESLEVFLNGTLFLRLPPELNFFGKRTKEEVSFTADLGGGLVRVDYQRDSGMSFELVAEGRTGEVYWVELCELPGCGDEEEEV